MKNQKSVLLAIIFGLSALLVAAGQLNFATLLQHKLSLYYDRHVPVKVHMTFNQPGYSAGDTAYFKVHLFTADDYRPIGGRQIVNINILNGKGEVLQRSKALLIDGTGFNQLPIAEDVPPGRYSIVAYNETMRDVDPSFVFQRPLWISGPFRHSADVASDALQFYPEGGHLIAGITNKVVVRGPALSSGSVISDDGAETVAFTLDAQGFGIFFMMPKPNLRYLASVNKKSTKTELPLAESDGVGMLVTVPSNKLPIRVTVQVPASSKLKSGLHLAMTSHGKVYSTATLSFTDNDFLSFAFPQENLREGLARFSVFTSEGSVVSERLVYIQGNSIPQVTIDLGRENYSTRDEIAMNIALSSSDGDPLASDLAVTVYRKDFMETYEGSTGNLRDNALLFGDLSGSLNTAQTFDKHDPISSSALDNYIITRKWERYSWRDVWRESFPDRAFRKYLHLEGRAFQTDNSPLPDSTRITFFLQKSVMIYEVYPDRSGEFDFSMLMDFYGEEEIFYKAENRGVLLPKVQVALDPGAHFSEPIPFAQQAHEPDPFHAFSMERKKITGSFAFHLLDRKYEAPPSLNALIEEEVFGADIVINMDDYLLFPTMSETLREIVPMLQHRKSKDRDIVKLFFDDRDRFAEEEPLFVIDGVITDNTTYFMSLKPVEVVSIKIINSAGKLQTMGSIGKNGIVLVETKIVGHAARVPRSNYAFEVRGLTPPSQNYRGQASLIGPRIPDLRTNLYWNPSFKTDSTGRASTMFHASDVTGTYIIKIEGFTERGEPIYAEKTFQVAFDPD